MRQENGYISRIYTLQLGGLPLKHQNAIASVFLLCLLISSVAHASDVMTLQVEPSKVVLELGKLEGQAYRVCTPPAL